MQNSSASPRLTPSPLSHLVRISSFLPCPLLPHPLTCSGGWDLDFNCLPFLNHRALETHAGEELCNIVCRLCDTHTFVDSINRYHLLTVGQLLGRGGGEYSKLWSHVMHTHGHKAIISMTTQPWLSELMYSLRWPLQF